MEKLIDLDIIEHNLKTELCKQTFIWFEENLSEKVLDLFNEEFTAVLYQAIYYDKHMFKLFVFDNLKMIDLDLNLKRIVYTERQKGFNYLGNI